MIKHRITPLEPQNFFSGIWRGEGELIPSRLNSWFVPKERIRLQSQITWLSDKIWVVEESFEFSSGKIIERKMFAELIGFNKVHITADDMPHGADITLYEKGFSFSPYYILGDFGGRQWKIRCLDDNQIDENGVIHDKIEMFYLGLRVAEMRLTVRVER